MSKLTEFENKIGIVFNNKDLLKQAFIHRSYLNENPKEQLGNNERLEFLGDAVLELVTTDFLFRKYIDKPEGDLTAYRAALVNMSSLAKNAQKLGMEGYLFLSKGEKNSTGKSRNYILANTFEALIGGLYIDGGYEIAKKFIIENLLPDIEIIIKNNLWQDSKSKFQEKAQESTGFTPIYQVIHEEGPDHNKVFTVGVFIDDKIIAEGKGSSKHESEQNAAEIGLKKMGWLE